MLKFSEIENSLDPEIRDYIKRLRELIPDGFVLIQESFMSKFIEQPAYETNEFKKDDYVKVYTQYFNVDTAEMLAITFNSKIHEVVDNGFVKVDGATVHFKQCRLLEEVKPREFYLFKSIDENNYRAMADGSKPSPLWHQIIKVREVLD